MKKRPRDINQLGKLMVDIATGDVKDAEEASSNQAEDETEKLPPLPRLTIPLPKVMDSETSETTT